MIAIVRARGCGYITCVGIAQHLDECQVVVYPAPKTRGIADMVVPWGVPLAGCAINKRANMGAARDKGNARLMMHKAGVCVPEPWYKGEKWMGDLIFRPNGHHGGRNLYVVRSPEEAERYNGGYFSALFKKTHEFRVHVAHGKVLALEDKHYTGRQVGCNRLKNGLPWTVVRWNDAGQAHRLIMLEGLRAVEALGLDFGGVDVMWDGKQACVCEANTAPTIIEDYKQQRYAAYFAYIYRHRDAKHWEFEKYTEAKSLFWKRFQLEA